MAKLAEYDTVLTADSVEWCPAPGLEETLACGTYQLNRREDTGEQRTGSLMLFHWDGERWAGLQALIRAHFLLFCRLTRILESDTAKHSFGILDMKWSGGKE